MTTPDVPHRSTPAIRVAGAGAGRRVGPGTWHPFSRSALEEDPCGSGGPARAGGDPSVGRA